MRSLELNQLGMRLVKEWQIRGVIAPLPFQPESEDEPKMGRVTGYLHPLFDPTNLDEMTGLLQVKELPKRMLKTGKMSDKGSYWVRLYDWSPKALDEYHAKNGSEEEWMGEENRAHQCLLTEWEDLRDLKAAKVGKATIEEELHLRPVVTSLDPNDDGYVTSPFMAAIPFMRAVMVSEMYLERNEECVGHPIGVFGQNAPRVDRLHPGVLIEGDFKWAQPGNLDVLSVRLDSKRQNLARVMGLPAHKIGNPPHRRAMSRTIRPMTRNAMSSTSLREKVSASCCSAHNSSSDSDRFISSDNSNCSYHSAHNSASC